MDEEYARRRKLTFRQAEGLEELPKQFNLKNLPTSLRNEIWSVLYFSIEKSRDDYTERIDSPWYGIMFRKHILFDHKPIDEFGRVEDHVKPIKALVLNATYDEVYEFIQFVLRDGDVPKNLGAQINEVLTSNLSAYRVVGGDTLVPIANEMTREALSTGLSDTASKGFPGAHSHLKQASRQLSLGDYAGSVRESIHAVESTARQITGKQKLSDALDELSKSYSIHKSLRAGFSALYGYTSDEKGIRHPLID